MAVEYTRILTQHMACGGRVVTRVEPLKMRESIPIGARIFTMVLPFREHLPLSARFVLVYVQIHKMRESIGIGDHCTTNALADLTGSLAVVVPDYLEDAKDRRREVENEGEWGQGKLYTRLFECSTGDLPTVTAGLLALGAPMIAAWTDYAVSRWIDGPKVQSISIDEDADTDNVRLLVTFQSVKLLFTLVEGYNETKRSAPQALGDNYWQRTEWGVAGTASASNIPRPGDRKDAWICQEPVVLNDVVLPGRVLVQTTWISRTAPHPILRPY